MVLFSFWFDFPFFRNLSGLTQDIPVCRTDFGEESFHALVKTALSPICT
jgi:hypothetical protein